MRIKAYVQVYEYSRSEEPNTYNVTSYPIGSSPSEGERRFCVEIEIPDRYPTITVAAKDIKIIS